MPNRSPVIPPPVPARLRRGHLGDRMDRYRAFGLPVAACVVMALPVIHFLNDKRPLRPLEAIAILVGAVLVGAAAGYLSLEFSAATGRGLARVMTGSGNIRPAASFSLQESLVIRGRPEEAAQAYRDHLALQPADHDARLALADVLMSHLGDPDGAEKLYLEVRAATPTAVHERVATESLIGLYRRTGNTGREMVELARFAHRYQGTAAAESARKALAELKRG